MMELVITVRGDEHPRINCRKIGANYYLIDRDVFLFDEKYYREELTFIDNFDKKRKLRAQNEVYTVYDSIKLRNKVLSTKYFHLFYDGSTLDVCESAKTDVEPSWFNENVYVTKNYSYILPPRKNNRVYSSTEHPGFASLMSSKKTKTDKFNSVLDVLRNLTFGFEIESSNGEIRENLVNSFKFVRLYDGSISGHEFVSVPLQINEFHYVEDMMKLLQRACVKNRFCSTHFHLGGIPYTASNFASILLLFKRLEHEIHSIIPPYKKSVDYFISKKSSGLGEIKDHCKYLPDHLDYKLVNTDVNQFAQNVASFFANNGVEAKHLGTSYYTDVVFNTRKWNLNRYFFVNFVNYLFKKNGTIEFRLMESTFDFESLLYWTLLNAAVVLYAINNKERIFQRKDKITLEDVITIYPEEVSNKIFSWIHERRLRYGNYLLVHDDFSSDRHFSNEAEKTRVKW